LSEIVPRWQKYASSLALGGITLVFLLPLIWVMITSIKPQDEIYLKPVTTADGKSQPAEFRILPQQPTLENFKKVTGEWSDLRVYAQNTVVVTVITILAVTFLSALCGYALAQIRFFGAGLLMSFLLVVMAIPWVVMLIPIYKMEITLGLLNSISGLALPYTAFFLPMGILIMRSAFLNIPGVMREAAIMDGANEWQVWRSVMLPLVRPALTVVALTTFMSCWKEFTLAVSLNSLPSATTLAVGITYLQDEAQSWAYGTLSAVIVLSVMPLLLVFILFQRQIVGGLTEGAVKG
jgi:ABC-type glycerol-3-phosphate transport system permease component